MAIRQGVLIYKLEDRGERGRVLNQQHFEIIFRIKIPFQEYRVTCWLR